MHQTHHQLHDHAHKSSASELLGAEHPLTRALRRRAVRVEQSLVVIVVLAASTLALLDGLARALAFAVAAAVVTVALACGAAMASWSVRDRVLELIVDGRGDLPLAAVIRERRRLLDRARRERMAASLDALLDEAQRPARSPRSRPIFDVRIVAAVAPELASVARGLRADDAALRGIAAIHRLMVDGTSALYGRDRDRLREDLRRIRYLIDG